MEPQTVVSFTLVTLRASLDLNNLDDARYIIQVLGLQVAAGRCLGYRKAKTQQNEVNHRGGP